jgi:hypothetical protein
MKKLLKSDGFISAVLTGFLFVQIVGLGLFFLIDAIFNNATPTLINWTLEVFWSDRGEGWLIFAPIIIIAYAFIGGAIKFLYSWHSENFMRNK